MGCGHCCLFEHSDSSVFYLFEKDHRAAADGSEANRQTSGPANRNAGANRRSPFLEKAEGLLRQTEQPLGNHHGRIRAA
jgi:hypothetical protein